MDQPLFQIFVILLLLMANGLFAMAEIAVVSARRARLEQWASRGEAGAQAALELARDPNAFLATVQIGITLVGILAGAFGGATLAGALAPRLESLPGVAPHGQSLAMVLVVLAITYFSLVLGELVPKRLALGRSERVAATLARPMQRLSALAFPLVRLLGVSTDLVIGFLGVPPSEESAITPEELRLLVAQGRASGVFETSEQDMIEGVLDLDERSVGAFMIPRTQILWLDAEDDAEALRAKLERGRHSYMPVARGRLDQVLGIVSAKDLLGQLLDGRPPDLGAILHSPLYVPESLSALELLDTFSTRDQRIALVVDEHGGIEGLVGLQDILEAIVGFAAYGGAAPEPGAIRREDGSWLIDGLMRIDDFKECLGLERLSGEAEDRFHTAGGFVMHQFGRLPEAGQGFRLGGLYFEVMDMDGRRVDKLLVVPEQAGEVERRP